MSTCCTKSMSGLGHDVECPVYGGEIQRLKRLEDFTTTNKDRPRSKHAEARRLRAKARRKRRG